MLFLSLVMLTCTLYQSADSRSAVVNGRLPDDQGEYLSDLHRQRRQAGSLTDALKGMDHHLQYAKSNCTTDLAKQFLADSNGATNRPSDMTVDEYASIRLYSYSEDDCPFYRDLNKHLRQVEGRAGGIFQAYVDLLRSALSKLPVYRGELWRALSADVYRCPVGETLSWYAFSSTSLDRSKSSKYGKLYKITNGQGYSIANYSVDPSEKEILLPPGMQLKVLSQESKYCVLEQLTSVSHGNTCAHVWFSLGIAALLQVVVNIHWNI